MTKNQKEPDRPTITDDEWEIAKDYLIGRAFQFHRELDEDEFAIETLNALLAIVRVYKSKDSALSM
jgi:hypothetical protein